MPGAAGACYCGAGHWGLRAQATVKVMAQPTGKSLMAPDSGRSFREVTCPAKTSSSEILVERYE